MRLVCVCAAYCTEIERTQLYMCVYLCVHSVYSVLLIFSEILVLNIFCNASDSVTQLGILTILPLKMFSVNSDRF